MHLSKINLPINEFISYLVKSGNFFEIKILINLLMQRNGYGIVIILSIITCNNSSIISLM